MLVSESEAVVTTRLNLLPPSVAFFCTVLGLEDAASRACELPVVAILSPGSSTSTGTLPDVSEIVLPTKVGDDDPALLLPLIEPKPLADRKLLRRRTGFTDALLVGVETELFGENTFMGDEAVDEDCEPAIPAKLVFTVSEDRGE